MVADRQARRGGASDPVSQGRPRSEERGMSFVKTFALAGSAVALLATGAIAHQAQPAPQVQPQPRPQILPDPAASPLPATQALFDGYIRSDKMPGIVGAFGVGDLPTVFVAARSEEHTSELQSLMRISYAVFCLKKKIFHLYTEHIVTNAI